MALHQDVVRLRADVEQEDVDSGRFQGSGRKATSFSLEGLLAANLLFPSMVMISAMFTPLKGMWEQHRCEHHFAWLLILSVPAYSADNITREQRSEGVEPELAGASRQGSSWGGVAGPLGCDCQPPAV